MAPGGVEQRESRRHRGDDVDKPAAPIVRSRLRYEGLGFEVVPEDRDVPAPLEFEVTAGKAVTWLIGAELVVMRGVGSGVG